MRQQSGTADLRALVYMDEVAGYLPPTANPPTKASIMLLLKQARAFGIGVVLSTQNPVDLDYKALSNAGTWLVGRLQTEQDKNRLLSGLSSAAGTVDVAAVSATISGLAKREFVLKRATQDKVEVLTTRWAMSYLRGPLTREQIVELRTASDDSPAINQPPATAGDTPPFQAPPPNPGTADSATPVVPGAVANSSIGADETPVMPAPASGLAVRYLDPGANWTAVVGAVPGTHLRAAAMARVLLRYSDARAGVKHEVEYECVLSPLTERVDPNQWQAVDYDDRDLLFESPEGAIYQLAPSVIGTRTWWTRVERDLTDHLARNRTLTISANPTLKLFSRVDEAPEDFAVRCRSAAAELADSATAALRTKYERKIIALHRRLDTANATVARQRAAQTTTYQNAAVDAVGNMLGGLLGGRRSRTSITATASKAAAARSRVAAAESKAGDISAQLGYIEAELAAEVTSISAEFDSKAAAIVPAQIDLARADVKVTAISLVWIPVG